MPSKTSVLTTITLHFTEFTPFRQVILNNIGSRFEAVRGEVVTGRERILRDARSHLEMMQDEF